MINENSSTSNETSRSLAGALSYLLPIIQFFYQFLPNSLAPFFPNKNIFFVASVITLIVSYLAMIWYRLNNFVEFTLPFQKKAKEAYQDYLDTRKKLKDNPKKLNNLKTVNRPKTISIRKLSLWLIPLVFILGFIFIGLNNPSINHTYFVSLLMAIIYSLIIIFTVIAATYFYEDQNNRKNFEQLKIIKTSRAIGLAIEGNAIPNIPRIEFISAREQYGFFPPSYNVIVKVNEEKYLIQTDSKAEVLLSVTKIKPVPLQTPPTTFTQQSNTSLKN